MAPDYSSTLSDATGWEDVSPFDALLVSFAGNADGSKQVTRYITCERVAPTATELTGGESSLPIFVGTL